MVTTSFSIPRRVLGSALLIALLATGIVLIPGGAEADEKKPDAGSGGPQLKAAFVR
jgi:hypothetical protein